MNRIRSLARCAAVLLATTLPAGCATVRNVLSPPRFTPEQTALLRRAIPAADSIVADSLFRAVARQLEAEEQIHWNEDKLALIPKGARDRPTEWLLARFDREGNYRLEDLSPERHAGTAVSAVTRPCAPYDPSCPMRTRVNTSVVRVDPERTIYALANTLVHERVHSFGQKHGDSQARAPNRCDAAYVLGDMAETLLRHRAEGGPVTPRQTLCLALHHRLRSRGVVRQRSARVGRREGVRHESAGRRPCRPLGSPSPHNGPGAASGPTRRPIPHSHTVTIPPRDGLRPSGRGGPRPCGSGALTPG